MGSPAVPRNEADPDGGGAEGAAADSVLTNDAGTVFVLADEGRWGTAGSNGGTLSLTLSGSTAATGSTTAGSTSEVASPWSAERR